MDETDQYIDNMRLQRVNAALLTSSLPKHLRKCASTQPLSCSFIEVHSSLLRMSMTMGCARTSALPRRWQGAADEEC